MATYYVDFVNGLDTNNGLGPDASDPTNKPWKTITKLLGAAGMSSGDTAYLSPAGQFRETVAVAMTSATIETTIIGDYSNARGFKTSGGVLVSPGPVLWTAYTTNDRTTPSASVVLNPNGRDFLTFRNIGFVGGQAYHCCVEVPAGSTDLSFYDCAFWGGNTDPFGVTTTAGAASNILLDRCWIVGPPQNASGESFKVIMTRHTADYDANITLRNTIIAGGSNACVRSISTGAGAGFGGGIDIIGCTMIGAVGYAVTAGDANLSTTFPITVQGCWIEHSSGGMFATTLGQIVEDYNLISAVTPRTTVSVGANSVSGIYTWAPLYHFGQEVIWGQAPRPWLSPMAASPLLGFGTSSLVPAYDIVNTVRPSGGASPLYAVGAYERPNSFGKETGTVRTGTAAISITGPGSQTFLVPVNASLTRINVYVRWNATYAGTKPQLQIDANTAIGVSAETITASGSSDTWERLQLSTFTPTAKGVVAVRVLSNDTNGGGGVFADDWEIA